jgi:hypothetical protein
MGLGTNEEQSLVSGNLTVATVADSDSPVGTYSIVPGGWTSTNYPIDFVNGTLTVTPAPLTLTADNATRPYGQTNPVFTGAITGIQNGDNISATYSCSATDSSAPGTYAIVPTLVSPGNLQTNYQVTLVNGTLTVLPAPVAVSLGGTVWYYPAKYPASQPSGNGVDGVSVTLSGGFNTNEVSAGDGSYSFSGLGVGQNYEISLAKSDDTPAANGVTTLDIALIRRQILDLAPLDSPYKLLAADVNASGTVTTLDIALIRRLILALTNTFPAGLWRFVPADYVFADPSNPWNAPTNRWYTNLVANMTGQDYVAIKLGDVNNSWVSPVPTPQVRLGNGGETKAEIGKAESRNLAPQVRLGNGTGPGVTAGPDIPAVRFEAGGQVVQPGQRVAVPVSVSRFHHATTAQFTLGWDPSALQYAGVGEFGVRGLGTDNFGTALADSGKLAFSWDDPQGTGLEVADGAALFTVYFEVIGAAGSVSPVAFGDSPTVREATVDLVPRAFGSADGQVMVVGERPVISCGGDAAKGAFRISVPSVSGRHYILESADSLSGANWRALGEVEGDGSVKSLADPAATTQQRFYRVRVE